MLLKPKKMLPFAKVTFIHVMYSNVTKRL